MRGKLNKRQEKVIERMFRKGPDGFTGGLRADNYTTIAPTSTATATRDLREMVELQAFSKQGSSKALAIGLGFFEVLIRSMAAGESVKENMMK